MTTEAYRAWFDAHHRFAAQPSADAVESLLALHDAMAQSLCPGTDISRASKWYRERIEKMAGRGAKGSPGA